MNPVHRHNRVKYSHPKLILHNFAVLCFRIYEAKGRRGNWQQTANISTRALADCHLIFKVDGAGECYSPLPPSSHARCIASLSSLYSRFPDRISLCDLILTFRTRTWLRQLFLLQPFSRSPVFSTSLSPLFLHIC